LADPGRAAAPNVAAGPEAARFALAAPGREAGHAAARREAQAAAPGEPQAVSGAQVAWPAAAPDE
jgi:hypothetical protein